MTYFLMIFTSIIFIKIFLHLYEKVKIRHYRKLHLRMKNKNSQNRNLKWKNSNFQNVIFGWNCQVEVYCQLGPELCFPCSCKTFFKSLSQYQNFFSHNYHYWIQNSSKKKYRRQKLDLWFTEKFVWIQVGWKWFEHKYESFRPKNDLNRA